MYDDYQLREITIFHRDLDRIRQLPLSERKENTQDLREILESDEYRERFNDACFWLLDGSFGQGAYLKSREVIRNSRMNKRAWIFQTVAALNYRVPQREACKLWNSLPKELQDKINEEIDAQIDFRLEEDEQ